MARADSWLVVWALVVVSVVGNLAIALQHPSATFWDEQVYNYAATLLLHGQSCPTVGMTVGSSTVPLATSCNYEHPPLVKALVALTIYILTPLKDASAPGSLPYLLASFLSFRLVQLTMGALCLPLMYSIARGMTGDRKIALLAALLLFLEPLFAFFSRLDYLDVPMIFFALCAYSVYFGWRQPPGAKRLALSGALLGLSVLSKETGLVLVVPLVLYHLLFHQSSWSQKSKDALLILGVDALVTAAGLQVYDTLAGTPFPVFTDQIAYMASYSAFLTTPHLCSPLGPVPWYFYLTYDYWMLGVSYNPVLLWIVLLWVPAGAFLLWRNRKRLDPGNRVFVFAALLFVVTFLQNELLCVGGRILWVWYFLPLVPSLSLGGAYLLTRKELPSWMRLLLGLLIVAGCFLAYYLGSLMLAQD